MKSHSHDLNSGIILLDTGSLYYHHHNHGKKKEKIYSRRYTFFLALEISSVNTHATTSSLRMRLQESLFSADVSNYDYLQFVMYACHVII